MPLCGERFVHMLDKGTTRQVMSLKTRCSRKRKYDDCEWEGELQHLNKHETDECEWAFVDCRYSCGESIPRRLLAEHEQDVCEQRPMNVKLESILKKMEERYKEDVAAVKEEFERVLREEKESLKKEAQQKDKSHSVKITQLKQTVEKKEKSYTAKFTQLVEGKDKSRGVEVKQMNTEVVLLKKLCS